MYEYNAAVEKITDGDTVHLLIDLGLSIFARETCRLYRINAPEMSTPEGKLSRDNLVRLAPVGSQVLVHTIKDRDDKYGRLLARIWHKGICINDQQVTDGHAVYKDY